MRLAAPHSVARDVQAAANETSEHRLYISTSSSLQIIVVDMLASHIKIVCPVEERASAKTRRSRVMRTSSLFSSFNQNALSTPGARSRFDGSFD